MHHPHVLSRIGNTPLVELRTLSPRPGVKILAKIECVNPGGSIKDRVALAMVEAAEADGSLTPGKTVIEATSGNTGVGLAMVCAVKGYRLKLFMPETASEERKRIMRAFGADIELTPGRLGTDGAIEVAYRLAREEPDTYVLMDQFNNPASIEAHYRGTAPEIWEATGGGVTHAVAALGTSGTVMGLARRLHEYDAKVQVIAVEPYPRHKIQGLKNMQESYPPGIFDRSALDATIHVEDEEAFETARLLARQEGILAGMSSGAAVAGALRLARDLESGLIVVIIPDSGERYLSTSLFAPKAEQGPQVADAASGGRAFVAPDSREACLYAVGPALDRWGSLSFWRRLAFLDVLARRLRAEGGGARLAVGLADLEDSTLKAARAAKQRRADYAAAAGERLARAAAALGMAGVEFAPVGDASARAAKLVSGLLSRGLAYEKLRSVYFDVARDKDYGRMAGVDLAGQALGKTVDLAAYAKENARDFTLLKRAALADIKEGEFWALEWGNVRPSWFAQMALAALAALPRVDLAAAGETHRFPHLENLRAIWAYGAEARPRAWMVVQPVAAAGEAKPAAGGDSGARPGLDALLGEGRSPLSLRLWLLSGSYHKPLCDASDTLAMWDRNRAKVQDAAAALSAATGPGGSAAPDVEALCVELRTALRRAVDDDLSLYAFWPTLFNFCREMRSRLGKSALPPAAAAACLEELLKADDLLGVIDRAALPLPADQWPPAVAALVQQRAQARQKKDFAEADRLRDELKGMGFAVEDTPEGPRVARVG
ncbi:MAG: cysteine synthase [Thermodesulfobacteriota bacterium]